MDNLSSLMQTKMLTVQALIAEKRKIKQEKDILNDLLRELRNDIPNAKKQHELCLQEV